MKKLTLAVASVVACTLPVAANATNGLFSEGWGAKSSGMAGGGGALPRDTMIMTTNPAGILDLGDRKDIGLMYFSPMREYTVSGAFSPDFPPFPGPTVESGSESFLVPNFGWSKSLDESSAFGVAVYGNGGMNTDYAAGDTVLQTPQGPFPVGTFGGGDAGVDYAQLFISATYARQISSAVSLGVAGILNYSQFKIEGISGFGPFSVNPGKLSDNGKDDDTGFGGLLSVHADFTDNVSGSLSYQTKISNKFEDYAGLFPNGGEFDIPPRANLGLAFKSDGGHAVTFDVERIFYEDSDAIGNPSSNLNACFGGDRSKCLGASDGAGFGWQDMTVYKLGLELEVNPDLVWRFGFSDGDQPIRPQDVTLNILAPGVIENHYSTGFTKRLEGGKEFSMSFMYAPEECVSGPSQFVPGQAVEICMSQVAVKGQYSW